jgi:hypothetical protein
VDIDFDKWFFAAAKLFHEMQGEIGLAEARRVFTAIRTPTMATAKQRRIIKNMELLALYDTMMPESNVQQLARLVAEKNKKLAKEDRYGPRGSTDALVLDKHIRRLITKRKAKQSALWASKRPSSS